MFYVAWVPSNQDKNIGVIAGYNEMLGMEKLAARCQAIADKLSDMKSKIFITWPESQDASRGGRLSGLIKQQNDATNWLNQQNNNVGDVKVVINLHSDAGFFSHVYGIYGKETNQPRENSKSFQLARDCALSIAPLYLNTHIAFLDYSGYVFYRNTPYTSALIECGSHQHKPDLEIIMNKTDEIALAMVNGARKYANLPPLNVQDCFGEEKPEAKDQSAFRLGEGFRNFVSLNKSNTGSPVQDEWHDHPDGDGYCKTENGLLYWDKKRNKVGFLKMT